VHVNVVAVVCTRDHDVVAGSALLIALPVDAPTSSSGNRGVAVGVYVLALVSMSAARRSVAGI
jgi:microcompartment protein CcmK/EutM